MPNVFKELIVLWFYRTYSSKVKKKKKKKKTNMHGPWSKGPFKLG